MIPNIKLNHININFKTTKIDGDKILIYAKFDASVAGTWLSIHYDTDSETISKYPAMY
jgi:hypothetical protein